MPASRSVAETESPKKTIPERIGWTGLTILAPTGIVGTFITLSGALGFM